MKIEEIIDSINLRQQKSLTPLQEKVLRYAWDGLTYNDMAKELHYQDAYIKNIASQLWQELSYLYGEPITKNNFRFKLNINNLDNVSFSSQPSLEIMVNAIEITSNIEMPRSMGFPGSPLSIHSSFYIERPPLENLAYQEVCQPGSLTVIQAPAKMGKSSLLIRTLHKAQQTGYKTVVIDLNAADSLTFQNLEQFLRWFCANVSYQLGLPNCLDEYWDEVMGIKMNATLYLQSHILASLDAPLILAINEFNRIFDQPTILYDFVSLLRFWHEQAKQETLWENFRLVIIHSLSNSFIFDSQQSLFNVGLSLEIPYFTLDQVMELVSCYGLEQSGKIGESEVAKLMQLLGGHPYLINLTFYQLAHGQISFQDCLQLKPQAIAIYRDYLQTQLHIVQYRPQILEALSQLFHGNGAIEDLGIKQNRNVEIEAQAAYQLERLGLVQFQDRRVSLRCQLYHSYFAKQLFPDRVLAA